MTVRSVQKFSAPASVRKHPRVPLSNFRLSEIAFRRVNRERRIKVVKVKYWGFNLGVSSYEVLGLSHSRAIGACF